MHATVAPYGSWGSPITIDDLLGATVGLGAVATDGADLYWTESRASDGGRVSLWHQAPDGTRTELTPEHNVRSRVHEYGGGAWDVAGGLVVFSDFETNRLFRVTEAGIVPLTPDNPALRFADLRVHPERNVVLAVCEDHSSSDIDATSSIVALSLEGGEPITLVAGADFYMSPELGVDGRLAWVEWNHPNMPWDVTTVQCGTLEDDLSVHDVALVATDECATYPVWLPDGTLAYAGDHTGFANLYAWDGSTTTALCPDDHDYAPPAWVLGRGTSVPLADGGLVCVRVVDGFHELGVVKDGSFTSLGYPAAAIDAVALVGSHLLVHGSPVDDHARVELFDPSTGERAMLRGSSERPVEPAVLSVAQPLTWDGPDGPVHGWYYPPTNAGFAAPQGELPPLVVKSHGGPTSMAEAGYSSFVQFWTSRGFAYLDVNFGGSTGFGRDYRNRLRGRWGLVDVADCVAGVQALCARSLADPRRVSIEGGSAGGYTTLQALTTSDVFAAGVSSYGIGDLETLATDTHKFESRYLDGLVGPYPEARDTYVERSPIHHVDRLATPMLILQGRDDRVVPPQQAEAMAAAVRAKGLPVALLVFDGEGHGFRRSETLRAVLEAKLSFYAQVYGYTPADDIPLLRIENLS